jgi:hypothetical protein
MLPALLLSSVHLIVGDNHMSERCPRVSRVICCHDDNSVLPTIFVAVVSRVVSLQRAGKYQRPAWRPSKEQKGLDERPLRASQWPAHP